MNDFLRRLRGLAGFSVFGAAAGSVAGLLWWLLESTVGLGSLALDSFGLIMGLWIGFGAFAAIGTGLLLSRYGGANQPDELSPRRVAILGALSGGLAPIVLVLLVGAGVSFEAFLVALMSAGVGGGIAGGLTAIGKAAPSNQLESGSVDLLEG